MKFIDFLIQMFMVGITTTALRAQAGNLVSNPSFEDFVDCNFVDNEFSIDPAAAYPIVGWIAIERTTPDYFNTCYTVDRFTNKPFYNVPKNYIGTQEPRTGNGYAGIYTYVEGRLYKEYLSTRLKQPLQKDSLYCVSFFTSTAEAGCFVTESYRTQKRALAVKNLGVHFSKELPTIGNSGGGSSTALRLQMHVNNTNGFLTDTENWVKISGVYIAKGGEEWLTIGNFLDNTSSDDPTMPLLNDSLITCSPSVAYNYLDDVTVLKVPFGELLARDTVLCEPDRPISVNLAPGVQIVRWSTGDTTTSTIASTTGFYTVTSVFEGCFFDQTLYVQVGGEKDLIQALDQKLCEKDFPVLVSLPQGLDSYSWSNGSNQSSTNLATPGTYSVRVTDRICYDADTFQISTIPPLPLLPVKDTAVCTTALPYAQALSPLFKAWRVNGTTVSPPVSINMAGVYRLEADWTCGTLLDTFEVQVDQPIQFRFDPNTIDNCVQGKSRWVSLDAPTALPNYRWSNGAVTPAITAIAPGWYVLESSNQCNTAIDSIYLTGCPPQLLVPQAFSPNGDGRNDFLEVFFNEQVQPLEMLILDRWGAVVFSTNQPDKVFWDGETNDKDQNPAVFTWMVRWRNLLENKEVWSYGDVTLLR